MSLILVMGRGVGAHYSDCSNNDASGILSFTQDTVILDFLLVFGSQSRECPLSVDTGSSIAYPNMLSRGCLSLCRDRDPLSHCLVYSHIPAGSRASLKCPCSTDVMARPRSPLEVFFSKNSGESSGIVGI